MVRKILTLLAALAVLVPASAQGVKWGVMGGLSFSDFSGVRDAAKLKIDNRTGWQAGMTAALDLGIVSVGPQILFVRQAFDVESGGETVTVRSNSLDVPVLASLRFLHVLHLYAGPVFTLVNSCKQKGGDGPDFGRVRPTTSYAVGLNVTALKHLLVDVRYNGHFKSKEVQIQNNVTDKFRSHNFALSVGYLF